MYRFLFLAVSTTRNKTRFQMYGQYSSISSPRYRCTLLDICSTRGTSCPNTTCSSHALQSPHTRRCLGTLGSFTEWWHATVQSNKKDERDAFFICGSRSQLRQHECYRGMPPINDAVDLDQHVCPNPEVCVAMGFLVPKHHSPGGECDIWTLAFPSTPQEGRWVLANGWDELSEVVHSVRL